MDLHELKKQFIREESGISDTYGKVFSFIDFSNVNNWFKKDTQDWNNKLLAKDERLCIDIANLKSFADTFSQRVRVYYGEDPKNPKSLKFTYVMRQVFGNRDVITKDLQKIKHYIELDESGSDAKYISTDENGDLYVEIRKCNFDVEISVDVIKMMDHYDTFCLFSGDADFVYLNNFLRKRRKKVILIKGGYITTKLKESADLVVNAQNIKRHIARIEKTKT